MQGETYTAYINSANAIDGDASTFSYQINFPPHVTYNRVVMLSASIPKTFYTIQNGENTMLLTEGTNNTTLSIAQGSYTNSSLAAYMTTFLTSSSKVSYSYTCTSSLATASPQTGLLNFSFTGGTTQPSFTFYNNTLADCLGFARDSTNSFVTASLNSTQVINFNTYNAMLIHSDGYVINPSAWRDDFLDYDYIGAPWPKNKFFTKENAPPDGWRFCYLMHMY